MCTETKTWHLLIFWWYTIELSRRWQRRCIKLRIIFPTYSWNIFLLSQKNPYNLRNNWYFYADSICTVLYGSESISLHGPKTWDLVPNEIKNSKSLLDFKHKIKIWRPLGCSCQLCRVYLARLGFMWNVGPFLYYVKLYIWMVVECV